MTSKPKVVEAPFEQPAQSVFESIVDFEHIIIIKKRIEKVIQGNDFVAIVPLCDSDWQKIERYGIVQESIDHSQPFVIL